MVQTELAGMPEPSSLRLVTVGDQVLVTLGRTLVYRYDAADTGMRNLAIVALTDAGRRVDEVAAVFGLTATYVSIMRGQARRDGSAGLVRRRGRPPKLSERQQAQARVWAGQGRSQQWIAERFGVARSVIGEVLARRGPSVQESLPTTAEPATAEPATAEPATAEPGDREPAVVLTPDAVAGVDGPVPVESAPGAAADASALGFTGSARIGEGLFPCRYAGVMLAHAYLHRVGAETIFATLTGGPARRYDDLAILSGATLGFALGAGTVEGTKHLHRAHAGVAVGLTRVPELATFRARLAALADGSDPLALQRAFAAGLLAADPADDPVYFVDDHFVPYSGARPVGKGWNTKRRHAQPGRDDTLLCDARGRAVVFGSGEPTGLSATLPGVLTQLRDVLGPHAPILLGFDRGGAYPVAFRACRAADAHWVTYRRGPLTPTTATPVRVSVRRAGRDVQLTLADETVDINDYGPARQLTLYDRDPTGELKPVMQVLTSDTTATGAALLYWLRARWRIENLFKYAAQHNGIDALADYRMDIVTDTRTVTNPARTAARAALKQAQADLAAAERALSQLLTDPGTVAQKNDALPAAHQRIEQATATRDHAKTALKPIPAKIPITDLNPDALRARPRLERRGLQMVLRLLAFNAEAWLAEHFNAYLDDPDEYRAILRHLLHLGGHVTYTPTAITVTLDRPDSPRVARALTLLTEELNTTPAHMPGDRRKLTYQVATPARISTTPTDLLTEV